MKGYQGIKGKQINFETKGYTEMVNDMIEKTSEPEAPWHIIEGNSKKYARIKILQTIIDVCDIRLESIDYTGDAPSHKKSKKK